MHITLFLFVACGTPVVSNYYYTTENLYSVADTGNIDTIPGDDESEDTAWEQVDLPSEMAPTTTPAELGLEPFAEDGVVYWIDATAEQIAAINTDYEASWWGDWGPLYSVTDAEDNAPSIDHLFVRTVDGAVADYGEMATRSVGQSTGAYLSATTIPNLSFDANQKMEDQYFEYPTLMDHLRLNNAAVGSMFGEPIANELWREIYAMPDWSYAYMGGTPWEDNDILIPMVAMEQYKPSFCDKNADFFGGGCQNIWEWWGYDITVSSVSSINDGCELHDGCNITDLTAFAQAVDDNLYYPGFEAATEQWFNWSRFQQHMCMSWFAQTGDDYIHNLNNIDLIQGDDGLFTIVPWSIDINAGLAWGGAWTGMDLWGWSNLSLGCEYDPECYEETIDTCADLLDSMEVLDPANAILPELYERLQSTTVPWGEDGGNGMLRSSDDEEYAVAYAFYTDRVEVAREELANYTSPSSCGAWWDTASYNDPRCADFYETSDTAMADTAFGDSVNDTSSIDTSDTSMIDTATDTATP